MGFRVPACRKLTQPLGLRFIAWTISPLASLQMLGGYFSISFDKFCSYGMSLHPCEHLEQGFAKFGAAGTIRTRRIDTRGGFVHKKRLHEIRCNSFRAPLQVTFVNRQYTPKPYRNIVRIKERQFLLLKQACKYFLVFAPQKFHATANGCDAIVRTPKCAISVIEAFVTFPSHHWPQGKLHTNVNKPQPYIGNRAPLAQSSYKGRHH